MLNFARSRTGVLIALIALLLPAAAFVQYRWLGDLSNLEQLRARTNLEAAALRFSSQFDGLMGAIYAAFHETNLQRPAEAGAPAGIERAIRSITPAGLIRQVHVIERAPSGAFTVRVIDREGRETGDRTWPSWLGTPATRADGRADDTAPLPPGLQRTLLDDVPAIVLRQALDSNRWLVIELDRTLILSDLLPTMLAGCFEGGIPVTYEFFIHREDAPTQVVYQSREGLSRQDFRGWVTFVPMFAIHSRDLDAASARTLMPDAPAHQWRLYIKPQSGALEAAVAQARNWNLAIGIGVLSLLSLTVVLLVISMQRVQNAARRQLELVARISHELRTPLSTITCAGENLADNLVQGPEDAQQYGQIIMREGRRLTKTLGDILLCCRLQARPTAILNLQPTEVGRVLDMALADIRMLADDERVTITAEVEPGLPEVMADRDALTMAIKNLIVNAIKYGAGQPVTVAVRSRRTATGRDVLIAVEDQGPGIPADDLVHIFEPFYRGTSARNLEIEGSGIGLSIVRQVAQAHGGRIKVASDQSRGTRFTLHLPALKPGPRAEVAPATS